jgi:hypothetical protein
MRLKIAVSVVRFRPWAPFFFQQLREHAVEMRAWLITWPASKTSEMVGNTVRQSMVPLSRTGAHINRRPTFTFSDLARPPFARFLALDDVPTLPPLENHAAQPVRKRGG